MKKIIGLVIGLTVLAITIVSIYQIVRTEPNFHTELRKELYESWLDIYITNLTKKPFEIEIEVEGLKIAWKIYVAPLDTVKHRTWVFPEVNIGTQLRVILWDSDTAKTLFDDFVEVLEA